MNEVISVYTGGVIATIEQFTLAEEELRQFVIYTYYNKDEEPLYVGCSKSFYDAHYFNSDRLSFFEEVEYVGFVFFDNEADMKDARKYFIKAREPKYNQRKCKDTQLLPGLTPAADHLVVSRKEMEQRWAEWLAPLERDTEEILEELQIQHMVKYLREKGQEDPVMEEAASIILDLYDRLRAAEAREAILADDEGE